MRVHVQICQIYVHTSFYYSNFGMPLLNEACILEVSVSVHEYFRTFMLNYVVIVKLMDSVPRHLTFSSIIFKKKCIMSTYSDVVQLIVEMI